LAIEKIWLQQPIAFARAGGSSEPVPAFQWTFPDLRPRSSARTAIHPEPSFCVDDASGELAQIDNPFVLFKDEKGIRPVCPFFELHGKFDGQDPSDSRLTKKDLEDNGLSLADIVWEIRHANHKAYIATHSEGDRIEASLRFRGDDHSSHELRGFSPKDTERPLVLPDKGGIPMGSLRAIRPTEAFPHIRLRFTAPKGLAYGPANLGDRLKRVPQSRNPIAWLIDWAFIRFGVNDEWKGFNLPARQLILNPQAAWMGYKLARYSELPGAIWRFLTHIRATIALIRAWDTQQSELMRFGVGPLADVGKLPPGLFATWRGNGAILSSLGLVDDLGDGIISCTLKGVEPAKARIVVGPPHFSPDRRPPVSIADDLMDKEDRNGPRSPQWAQGGNLLMAKLEIQDLLDRAFETAGASNLDVWAEQRREENASAAVYRGDADVPFNAGQPIWEDLSTQTVSDLPLFALGIRRHRRNSAEEIFEQIASDNPGLITQWIRDQDDARSLYYDNRMPALMRGSDRRPLHLTRRQMAAFRSWFKAISDEKTRQDNREQQQSLSRSENISGPETP
jgi:hypothetical protein